MAEANKFKTQSRIDIIQTIKTPLGFFTLVVLIVEIVFGVAVGLSQGNDRTYLIIGMLALIFILVFIVAGLAYCRPEALTGKRPLDKNLNLTNLSPSERIAKYREMIEKETKNNLLLNFYVPDGYTAEVSSISNLAFGFCYPKSWSFSRFPKHVQYGFIADTQLVEEIGFARNMNLIISDISGQKAPLQELYEVELQETLATLANAKLVFREDDFIFQGLQAMRSRIDWMPQTEEQQVIACYQLLVVDKERKILYVISFTTLKEDFEKARPIFDNIANTFRI